MTPVAFSLLFAAALLASIAVRLWLATRQVGHVSRHRDAVPAEFSERITLHAHRRAADYTVARVRLDIRPSGGAWETVDMCSVVSGQAFHNGFGGAVALAAGTDIRLHCIDVTSANSTVTGHIDVVLLK